MIISEFDIQQRRKEYEEQQREKTEPLTINNVNIIGHVTMFFFATNKENGEKGFGAATARLLKIIPPEDVENSPFKVDLAIPSFLPDQYVEMLDVLVYSVVIPDPDGIPKNGLCRAEDAEIIREMVEKRNQTVKKPGLQLVVNNPDKQPL